MLIYDSILSSPIKRNLLRQHRLQETLPSSPTRFQPSFRSPMSATLPCASERTGILRKSLRMSNWIVCDATGGIASARSLRSEEHTSELQSRFDLVCRLLLE